DSTVSPGTLVVMSPRFALPADVYEPVTLARPGCTGSATGGMIVRDADTGERYAPPAGEGCDQRNAPPLGSTFTLFPGDELQLGWWWRAGFWAPEQEGRYEVVVTYRNEPELALERWGLA